MNPFTKFQEYSNSRSESPGPVPQTISEPNKFYFVTKLVGFIVILVMLLLS